MKKKVSLLTLGISCVLVFLGTFAISKRSNSEPKLPQPVIKNECPSMLDQIRLKNYHFVQPLLLANNVEESSSLSGLRNSIEQYLNQIKANKQIDDATVYFRKLNNAAWFCINPNQTYNPASLSKIIYLLTFLKEADENKEVLNKKVFFSRHFSEITQQNIKDFALKENTTYTIKELLTFCIQHSDNDATVLLGQNMNMSIYNQLFIDLNIPTPPGFGEYNITAIDYSKFFRVLYNATYIRPENSEFGLKLLTLSTYSEGLKKGIDPSIPVAHKFGERILGNQVQLHEFGIVFVQGEPYLIGVMSRGSSLAQLSTIVAEISRLTYSQYVGTYIHS